MLLPDDYDQCVSDLAALTQLHRFCAMLNRKREELARQCPAKRKYRACLMARQRQ